jgi:hypothetical protein
MGSSPTSDRELARLRSAVRGTGELPGLATLLPLLQKWHRRQLRKEEYWTKEELVRHPEPRALIRAMRRAGNLDQRGLPVRTFDARRFDDADLHENRVVRNVVDDVRTRLSAIDRPEALELLEELEGALARAPYLRDVRDLHARVEPTAALVRDPLYRAILGHATDLARS